jgi:hypothetical protein
LLGGSAAARTTGERIFGDDEVPKASDECDRNVEEAEEGKTTEHY